MKKSFLGKLVFIFVLILLLFGSLHGLQQLKVDNSLKVWFVENDPALISYQNYLRTFGNDEVVVTLWTDSIPIYNKARLNELKDLTVQLAAIKGVKSVQSLYNTPLFFHYGAFRSLDSLLLEDKRGFSLEKSLKKLKGIQTVERFVSDNHCSVVLYTTMDTLPELEERRAEMLTSIYSCFEKTVTSGSVAHGGTGVIYDAINLETISSSAVFTPLSFLLILLLVIFFTRKFIWALIFALSSIMSLLSMFAVLAYLHIPLNMTIVALLPLILVINLASIIHIYVYFSRHRLNAEGSFYKGFKPILIPLLLTSGTTALGFLSLLFTGMKITREFGFAASIGVVFSLLFCLTFVWLFSRWCLSGNLKNKASFLSNWAVYCVNKAMFYPKQILVAGLFFVGISFVSLIGLTVDTHTFRFLPQGHKVKSDHQIIEQQTMGYLPLDFVLTPVQNIQTSQWLKQLRNAQNKIEQDSSILRTYSLSTLKSDMKKVWSRQQSLDVRSFSDSDLLELGKQTLLFKPGKRQFKLSVFGKMQSVGSFSELAQHIEDELAQLLPPGTKIEASGYLPLYSRITRSVVHDQLSSIVIALLLISVLLWMYFKSLRVLVYVLVANVLPLWLLINILSWADIWIDMGTVTLAAALLGIIVDDTVHFIYFYKKNYRKTLNVSQALNSTALHTGRAIFTTTIILMLGMGVLGFSPIATISNTGVIVAVIALFALLSDLFVLPALIKIREGK